jgi:hypothetical protein
MDAVWPRRARLAEPARLPTPVVMGGEERGGEDGQEGDGTSERPCRSAVLSGPSLVPPKTVTTRRREVAFCRSGRRLTMSRMRA